MVYTFDANWDWIQPTGNSWDPGRTWLQYNSWLRILIVRDIIFLIGNTQYWNFWILAYKDWKFFTDSYYWQDYYNWGYNIANKNWDILYFNHTDFFDNIAKVKFDFSSYTFAQDLTTQPTYRNNINNKNFIIWDDFFWIDYPRSFYKQISWIKQTFFTSFFDITDFSILHDLNNYTASYITSSENQYNSFIFTNLIKKNNFSDFNFLWYDFYQYYTLYWASILLITSNRNSATNVNKFYTPLLITWKDLNNNIFRSYINTIWDLISVDINIAPPEWENKFLTWTTLTDQEIVDDIWNLDTDWDWSVSIIESTLAPITIVKNVVVKISTAFKNIWVFLKELLNIWNISFIPKAEAYSWSFVFQAIDQTEKIFDIENTQNSEITKIINVSKYWFIFLIFFIMIITFLFLVINRK